MKKQTIVKNGINHLCVLCLAVLAFAFNAFAQNDKPVEMPPTVAENQSKPDIPQPKSNYEYVAPQNITDFILALKETGKRGFKLDKLTAVPGYVAATSKGKAKNTNLAGIVKYGGEKQYDYNFFYAEGESAPDQKLRDLGKDGWYFRDVITVYGGGDSTSLPIEDIFANQLRKVPTIGNIYILERVIGDKQPVPDYKLLKAGVGLGKNPTPKMQALLDAAVAEGYAPVGTYISLEFTSLITVDSFFGIIVEKNADAKKSEYKFVRSNRSDGLRKEIETASKEGFRIGEANFNTAVLVRDAEAKSSAPVTYQWLEANDKTYAATLAATLAKNPTYLFGGVDMVGSGDFIKSILVFENNPAANSSEYKTAVVAPKIPKQFKKKPQEYLKTLDKPEVTFQKFLDEGYTARDLYFSEIEGLTVLFERQK